MANINDAFPSKYLRAHDLNGNEPIVTIERVDNEQVGDDRKLVVYFKGKTKGLVLNKTNATAIADILHSEDTDDWSNGQIKLVTARVDYQGKRVDAIRIDAVKKAAKPSRPAQEPVEDVDDERVPF